MSIQKFERPDDFIKYVGTTKADVVEEIDEELTNAGLGSNECQLLLASLLHTKGDSQDHMIEKNAAFSTGFSIGYAFALQRPTKGATDARSR